MLLVRTPLLTPAKKTFSTSIETRTLSRTVTPTSSGTLMFTVTEKRKMLPLTIRKLITREKTCECRMTRTRLSSRVHNVMLKKMRLTVELVTQQATEVSIVSVTSDSRSEFDRDDLEWCMWPTPAPWTTVKRTVGISRVPNVSALTVTKTSLSGPTVRRCSRVMVKRTYFRSLTTDVKPWKCLATVRQMSATMQSTISGSTTGRRRPAVVGSLRRKLELLEL